MRFFNAPVGCLSSMLVACLMLPACINGLPQQNLADPLSYADVEKNLKAAIGKNVFWTGQMAEQKTTSDAKGNVENTTTYSLQPQDVGFRWFVVHDDTAQRTEAAKRLDRTPGDRGIRKVSGTISKTVNITFYVNREQRRADVPFISNATIDAPDNATKK